MSVFISVLGILVLLGIGFLLSTNRGAVNPRTVFGALAIQIVLGALVLYVPIGREILNTITAGVAHVINYANEGIGFLFGGLVSDKMFEVFGGGGFVFAFRVLPIVVFFSSLVAVLYYLGVMQKVIQFLGGGLREVLGTSKTESLSATANIFVSQTEAPLVVKPYIAGMTRSELFAVMVGGLASIAGSVMVGYASMGVELKYLIAASFMAAPGGLLMAKLIVPETETPEENVDVVEEGNDAPANAIDAAATGASNGLKLAVNIGAMLIAFISLIALFNGLVGGIGGWFGYGHLTIQEILGWVFAPIAWLIGVPSVDIQAVGSLIGQKLILNEFVAYSQFLPHQETMQPISQAITIFALCGFANFASIAVLLGGLGILAPSRRQEVAQLGIRAVAAATLANLMSATIAGLFIGLSLA
ncbi:nucleoside transporter NupC [Oleiphilus sp. HI0009]|nr:MULTISPECIES: NupC/NupG family nucleoside CNT transporter [unclassified Oleiphilus]KZX82241.1 nucleoside transporter NupC [Oleiphilus sp. HI0009]KZY61769.1 nucleoside transporter NupC [Oleiphilus sp. HI0066]KZY70755.1 nucleoside transporter NupC [Oleiphilus sp. HI0067]